MGTFFLVVTSIYVGVALYEFYMSFLMSEPLSKCIKQGIQWPIDVYRLFRLSLRRDIIDREGP